MCAGANKLKARESERQGDEEREGDGDSANEKAQDLLLRDTAPRSLVPWPYLVASSAPMLLSIKAWMTL